MIRGTTPTLKFKVNKWHPTTPYKKVNGVWVPQTDIRDLLNEEYIKKGD